MTLPSKKLQFKDFIKFENFNQEILKEIIREGESEMIARLETANSTDQRALSIVGFQLTILIALSGACYSILEKNNPDIFLVVIIVIAITGLSTSAYYGIQSVRPKLFCFPGNDPKNWRISEWNFPIDTELNATLKRAMVEQCFCLHTAIFDNKRHMEENAEAIKNSIDIMYWTIIPSIFSVILILCFRAICL